MANTVLPHEAIQAASIAVERTCQSSTRFSTHIDFEDAIAEAALLAAAEHLLPPACPACGCRTADDPDAKECGCDAGCNDGPHSPGINHLVALGRAELIETILALRAQWDHRRAARSVNRDSTHAATAGTASVEHDVYARIIRELDQTLNALAVNHG